MLNRISHLCLLTLALAVGCADPQDHFGPNGTISQKASNHAAFATDYYNDPMRIDANFETRFAALPTMGSAKRLPWTDTYWPKNKGGIAYRWQTDESHTYTSPTYDAALEMSEEALAKLSPTEKYDLYAGNKAYTLTHRIKAENRKEETDWQGYCHGWTQASIHFDEPQPVVMTNADGLRIPFGSSDIKALLTYFQGEVVHSQFSVEQLPFKQEVTMIGSLCTSNKSSDPACADVNPGAFHVIMTNMVGIRSEAFGIDATTTAQKWNQPVHTYASQVLERWIPETEDPNIVEAVGVRSAVTYTAEIEPQWQATTGTSLHSDHTKTYHYVLYLDSEKKITGGEWAIPLQDGSLATFEQLREYFVESDENGDGEPDNTSEMVDGLMWQYFDIPDYAWVQGRGAFSQTYEPPFGPYAFINNSVTTRVQLYNYLAKLDEIYSAAVR